MTVHAWLTWSCSASPAEKEDRQVYELGRLLRYGNQKDLAPFESSCMRYAASSCKSNVLMVAGIRDRKENIKLKASLG